MKEYMEAKNIEDIKGFIESNDVIDIKRSTDSETLEREFVIECFLELYVALETARG